MQRYRPIGWKYESYRHSLAARGISTRRSFADIVKRKDVPFRTPEGILAADITSGEVPLSAEFPEGAIKHMQREEGEGEKILDIMAREPSPFNKEEYIEYYANNPKALELLPEDIDRNDPVAVRAFIENRRQMDMRALLEAEMEEELKPTAFPRSGKTIPKLTAGIGSEAPVLVTKELFDRMSLEQRDAYVRRMISELGGEDLESIRGSMHPGDAFRTLGSFAQKEYIDRMFNKDIENERILDIAEKRGSNISGIEVGQLERGKFLYTGESELLRRQNEARKELDEILARGENVSSKTLYRIADVINPMAMQELRALDVRRVAKAEEMRLRSMLDDALEAGQISKEDYNERMFRIDSTSAEIQRKTDRILSAAQQSKVDTKRRLSEIASMKGEPIIRSVNAQIGMLSNLPDSEFFQKSSALRSALRAEKLGDQGLGSRFVLSSLPQSTKQDLIRKIDEEEAYRRIIMSERQMLERPSKKTARGVSLPQIKAKVQGGERVEYQDIVKLLRRLTKVGQ